MNLGNKKILITGGAGFIGSHTADKLIDLGANVVILDNLSTGKKQNLNPKAKFYRIDIQSSKIAQIFKKEQPEYIYHFAFNTNVPLGVENPLYDAQSIIGSLNVIKEAQKLRTVKKIIFASSGFLYGNSAPRPTDENQHIEPISPYVVSKYAVELYLKYFSLNYGLSHAILRYAAVYGPRQTESGAMRAYIRDLSSGRQSEMYGSGKTRDYVYIDDVVKANLTALDVKDDYSNPVFNIGTGQETYLTDLYKKIADLLGKEAKPIYLPDRPGEQQRYCLNISKAKEVLGWVQEVGLEDGLKLTLKWWGLV